MTESQQIETHVFTHAISLAGLLQDALSKQNREEMKYFWGELNRIGILLFGSLPGAILQKIPDIAPFTQLTEKKEKTKRAGINYKKPLNPDEQRLLEVLLLQESNPASLEDIAIRMKKTYTSRTKGVVLGRIKLIMPRALSRFYHVFAIINPHETELEFMEKIKNRYTDTTADEMKKIAQTILKEYQIALPSILYYIVNKANKPLSKRPSFRVSGVNTDWLLLLNAAFLHTDGPSLDPTTLSKRTELPQEFVQPMLNGALDSMRIYTNEINGDIPSDVVKFINKLRARWPDKNIDDILAVLQ